MDNSAAIRILTGEATAEEKELFYRDLLQNKEDEKEFLEMKDLWVRASLNNDVIDVESEYQAFVDKVNNSKSSAYSPGNILRYAAIFIALLGIGGILGYLISLDKPVRFPDSGIQKYTALKGSVSIIEFADGTKVWLDSGSELIYKEDFNTRQRLAELKGEAYFEVKHREDCPFIIKAKHVVVKDLGTTFNIKAYPEDNFVETSLVEGKADILMSGETSAKDKSSTISIKPGQSVVCFSEDKHVEYRSIESNVLSAWREGRFVIRDQRLEDIFKELSRWYDVKFTFKNQAFRDYRYTGNIKKTTTAQHVMKMLQLTANFNYRIVEKTDKSDEIIIY
jgi:transmembrane sensor